MNSYYTLKNLYPSTFKILSFNQLFKIVNKQKKAIFLYIVKFIIIKNIGISSYCNFILKGYKTKNSYVISFIHFKN